MEVEGSAERLPGTLLHHPYRDLEHFVAKTNTYTTAAAEALLASGAGTAFGFLVRVPAAFVRSYVVRGGFLDGARGFLTAALAAYYVFLKYAKLSELRRSKAS